MEPSNPFTYCSEPVAGIDLSLRSPAITVIHPTSEPSYIVPIQNCTFFYLTDRKSLSKTGQFNGQVFGSWEQDGQRYETISEWVISILHANKVKHVGIEGYAYSKNWDSLTGLAENLGLLKYFLYKNNITYDLYPPSTIKKCATGSGNADKTMMVQQFTLDTQFDIMNAFGKRLNGKPISPIHDIADSYYVACSARVASGVQNRDYGVQVKPEAKRRKK